MNRLGGMIMDHRSLFRMYAAIIIGVVFTAFLSTELLAESENREMNKRDNSLYPGSWSIQFQIEDDIGLKPFNGMIISVKRHVSKQSAFRISFNLDIDFDDDDSESQHTYSDSTVYAKVRTTDYNAQRIEVNFAYLNYPRPDSNINLFWGAGPFVRYSRSRRETEEIRTTPPSYRQTTINTDYLNSWGIGILGLAGVEWFATKNISFHAEYRASAVYSRSKRENAHNILQETKIVDTSETASYGWDLHGVSVILGISLYF